MSRAIRRVRRLSLTVVIALLGVIAIGVSELQILTLINSRHHDALVREKENVEHQHNAAINRAINVETWCGAINDILANERVILETADPALTGLVSRSLDCEHIVQVTLQSGTHKPHITQKGNPLVFRALLKHASQ